MRQMAEGGPPRSGGADDRGRAEPPRSARGTNRSASAPRAGSCREGRSGSLPRAGSRYGIRAATTSNDSSAQNGMSQRAASSIDCASEHDARRGASAAVPHPAPHAGMHYTEGGSCPSAAPPPQSAQPASYFSGAQRNSLGPPALDARYVDPQSAARPQSFADTIETMLSGHPREQCASSPAHRQDGPRPAVRSGTPASPAGAAHSYTPSTSGYQQRVSSPAVDPKPVFADPKPGIHHHVPKEQCNGIETNGVHLRKVCLEQRQADPPESGLVLYSELEGEADKNGSTATPGLGLVQPKGRVQFLQEMESRLEASSAPPPQTSEQQRIGHGGRPPRAPLSGSVPSAASSSSAGGFRRGRAVVAQDPDYEVEWSSMSDPGKLAVKQWAAGQLGGRHCMLMIEQDGCMDTASSLLGSEASMANLRDGAALNVLSGLQADLGLVGGKEAGWLFDHVFAKTPEQVLQEAISAVLREIGDPRCSQASDFTAEQANLALRRRVMKVQYDMSSNLLDAAMGKAEPQNGDEHLQTQVWCELARLYSESGMSAFGGGGASASNAGVAKDKQKSVQRIPLADWGDGGVMRELGKPEAEFEQESQQMALDALRNQNKYIEEYVIRLVRRRDDLKQIIKLAEERDSYFILGLDGPEATDDEIKKAYRNLARKEHPDKAGIGNKKRFQQIQQAYTAVLKQKKEGAAGIVDSHDVADKAKEGSRSLGTAVYEAHRLAEKARDSADQVAASSHRALKGCEDAQDMQKESKKKAFRTLRDLTRAGCDELKRASGHLRVLGEAICSIADCAETAMSEQKELTSNTVAGIGLRDRAVIVEDAGRSALASADLLEKISEATDATLKKVEKASPDGTGEAGGLARKGGSPDAAGLLQLGVRLLTESLTRTSAVAKRAAEEAIGGATKAFELGRGLVALDVEVKKEKEKKKAKENSFDEDTVMTAGDAERKQDGGEGGEGGGEKQDEDGNKKDKKDEPPPSKTPRANGQTSPRDQLKCAAKRVKERHVALRVKNLSFLNSLNDEALKLQDRLWSMLERSRGALLPDISIPQKGQLFDLVAQLLDFSVVECTRLCSNPALPAWKILEKSLAFALALEHTQTIAMPSDSRTQALKLAALVDVDLLCQIIDGPFKRRLISTGAKRRMTADKALGPGSQFTQGYGGSSARRQSLARSGSTQSQQVAGGSQNWDESVQVCTVRVVHGLRRAVAEGKKQEAGADAGAK